MSFSSQTNTHRQTGKSTGRNRRSSLLLRRFLRSNSGSVYALAAFLALPMVGLIGVGADTAQIYLVKSRLASSVDAAALAGGKLTNSNRVDGTVRKYFALNFPAGYMGADLKSLNLSRDKTAETLTVAASATVKTAFMHLFGFDSVEVSARSEVTQRIRNLNLSLSIDVSGSMGNRSGGQRKIDAARNAAKDLVSILHAATPDPQKLRIGLVPWSGKVNVSLNGSSYDPKRTQKIFVTPFVHPRTRKQQAFVWKVNSTPVPLLDKPHDKWSGCVYARYTHDNNTNNDGDLLPGLLRLNSAGWVGWEPIVAQHESRSRGGQCVNCTPCSRQGVTPMTADRRTIDRALDQLRNPGGHTNIAQGLLWGWRLLDSKAPFTETVGRTDSKTIQAVVLLSDGAHCGAKGDAYANVFGGCSTAARRKMDARLRLIAANMKKEGVIIYTIQFGTNSAELRKLLSDVASSSTAPHYHYAPDSKALQAVFKEIAGSLSNLRISK